MYGFDPNILNGQPQSQDEVLKRLAQMLRDIGFGGQGNAGKRFGQQSPLGSNGLGGGGGLGSGAGGVGAGYGGGLVPPVGAGSS